MNMYKVLLVDDEQIERMALARRIDKYFGDQVDICQATDGRDAIKVFQEEKPDIIIMDISMPEMNGVMAAKHIRDFSDTCSIIFLSAYDDFNYARNAIKVGALDYLLKPCELADLLAVMETAIHIAEDNTRLCTNANIEKTVENIDENNEDELAVAERMKKFVDDHYMEDISMQEAASKLGYSDAYFSKLFKQYFNQNFTAYLTDYRVKKAKELLKNSKVSIKEISRMVGYTDSNYFAKIFKRIEGIKPSKFRESL